jgi:hypothetical protein
MDHRWTGNWLMVSPGGAVRADVGWSRRERRATRETLRALPAGTPVVLCASAPLAWSRCRRFAARAAVELDRGYLAFPSATAPAYLVEDAPAPARVFADDVLVAPPGSALTTPISAVLGVLRRVPPWRLLRTLAPGRVVVGWRA